jgi:uncharacterized protein DUF4255
VSNALAIATTTVVLGDIVQSGISVVPGAQVTTVRPDEKENGAPAPEANVFLYQLTPNAALRNADLPTRTSNGDLRRRPQVALDLHYLISFYGDDTILEPQRLAGGAISALHARPQVTRSAIEAIITAAGGAGAADPRAYLAETDLAEQVEHVTFTPLPLNLEELSKMWATLFRVPYVLSIAYQASVVLIESPLTPTPALPVRVSDIAVIPVARPEVESVTAGGDPGAPIVAGATLTVRGKRLRGDLTRLRVGDTVVEPAAADTTDTEIRAVLGPPLFGAGTLRAGVQGAQAVHLLELGDPPTEHRGFESNMVPFLLRPTLTSTSLAGDTVTVVTNPPAGARQKIVLLLDEVGGDHAYAIPAQARADDADPIEVDVAGVESATYLVRVQVAGAESPLDADFNGPTLTVP